MNDNRYGTKIVHIKYDKNVDYEFIICRSYVQDFKYYSPQSLMKIILVKLINHTIFNENVIPNDYNQNYLDYIIEYTVGDFIIGKSEQVLKFSKLQKRVIVALPIKFKLIKKMNAMIKTFNGSTKGIDYYGNIKKYISI